MTHVAVIIVNWNGGDLLKACLDSIKQQTVKPSQIMGAERGTVSVGGHG